MIQARSSFAPERLAPERPAPTNFAPKRFARQVCALEVDIAQVEIFKRFPGKISEFARRDRSQYRTDLLGIEIGTAARRRRQRQQHRPDAFSGSVHNPLSAIFGRFQQITTTLSFACSIARCCICSKSTARFPLKVEAYLPSLRTRYSRFES
jgi:hypothetical protein